MKKTKVSEFFERLRCRPAKTEADGANKSVQNEEYERCAMCGELTAIPISLPINFRENYEIGFGQICDSCKAELRVKSENENVLSYAQMMIAVENSKIEL